MLDFKTNLMYNYRTRGDDVKQNYQIVLNNTLKEFKDQGIRPTLLLHACCAPCSSYVLEYLNEYFDITVFFYNPNITEYSEYEKRSRELVRLINEMPLKFPVKFVDGGYTPQEFISVSKGYETAPEGGARCVRCYRLRLEKTASVAVNHKFDYFTTTLTISPHKNAQLLNELGKELSEKYGIAYLFSDFKKNNGYKRSCELSEIYGLYRQNYCGCIYSKRKEEI